MLDLVTLIDVLPFRLIQLDKKEMLQRQNKFPFMYIVPKPSLKIRTANAIFWISLGVFRDYSQKFFFRNKTFLLFKIES